MSTAWAAAPSERQRLQVSEHLLREQVEMYTNDIRLLSVSKRDMRWLHKLYDEAFPKEEKISFIILRMRNRGNAEWLKITLNGKNAGFFYVIKGDKLVYLSYFAIKKNMRGKHIGTEAMIRLIKKYQGRLMFLAIEKMDKAAPNYDERKKRKQFYERCGYRDVNRSITEGYVTYDVLGTGKSPDKAEYHRLMMQWLGLPLNLFVTAVMNDNE